MKKAREIDDAPPGSEIYVVLNPRKPTFLSKIVKAAALGFADPFVMPKGYSYRSRGRKGVCMHYIGTPQPVDSLVKQVEYCLHHQKPKENVCSTHMIMDKPTLDFLQYHTKDHKFQVGNKTEQREISGLFQMVPISPELVKVSIDHERTQIGDSENASYHESVGTFHTHPREAYERHEVCVAFPSGDDFATTIFLYANQIGAFHVLSSIEGLYVITVKPSFMKKHSPTEVFKSMKKWEEYVMDRYDVGYPDCSLKRDNRVFWQRYIGKYIKKINKQKVFHVQFKPWDQAHEPFEWNYHAFLDNCVVSDRQFKHVERFSTRK